MTLSSCRDLVLGEIRAIFMGGFLVIGLWLNQLQTVLLLGSCPMISRGRYVENPGIGIAAWLLKPIGEIH